jgi:ABC-type multidrug transport system fused ATPase/permease subunit
MRERKRRGKKERKKKRKLKRRRKMKTKIEKILKNPVQKTISSFVFAVAGFLLVRCDGTTILDGLISGFGLIIFFLSIFSFSFSLCKAVSEIMGKEREKEWKRERGKRKSEEK